MKECDVLLIGYEELENLGMRSIAAFLAKHGIKVKIEPYGISLKENILASIRREEPKIVGFSLIFQRMLFEFADLIAYLRQNGVTAHFTMGGHFPSIEYRGTLESITGLDSVVRGEGEYTLLELFQYLDQPDLWSGIEGLAYRRDGEIRVTSPRPLIQDLDSLPYPIRRNQTATHRGLGICSLLGSRGCYYNCSFCSIQQFYRESPGQRRRSRSPSNVVQEMEHLFYECGIRIFIFEDDDMFMKGPQQRQWIDDLVKELKRKKLGDQILWRVSCRVDDVDAELISKMMEVGLISVYLGIESGNNQGLKTYNKHYSVDKVYETINTLQNLNMPFEFGFMILSPESNFETVKEDIVFLKKISKSGQSVINFTKMVPYAGTPISSKLQNEGRLKGTIDSPDYTYTDSRLELLQLFFTMAFHSRNFDSSGLVERLRLAKFDAIVLNKFFSDKYDTRAYINALRDLIRQSNDIALEKMSMAVNFMSKREEDEILDNWQFLQYLAQEENKMESQTTAFLNRLMASYGYGMAGITA
ncbi:MAG: radical SAM protein [Candidatus Methanoperedens sp.]|nr:radical SAM protein [Candidatus Methanoperedens sp.]CAG1003781.1 Anaerobic magnesium-protoporphyrin IX monomethyl ester cyclase [Methanosarcinales archaeon]